MNPELMTISFAPLRRNDDVVDASPAHRAQNAGETETFRDLTEKQKLMARIVARDEPDGVWRCRYCRIELDPLAKPSYRDDRRPHREHVVPRVRGGSNAFDNLVMSCSGCNARKGSKLLSELEPDWHLWRTNGDAVSKRRRQLSAENSVLRRARLILAERGITLDEWIDPNEETA